MSDLISRALFCGLGLANLSKEAIHKTAEDLVNQSKLSEAEGRRLVKEFQRRSAQAQQALEKQVDAAVHKALKALNLAVGGESPKGAGKTRRAGAAKKARRR